MKQVDFNTQNLRILFREVGLYSPKDQFYTQRIHKHQQVLAYISQIKSTLNKLSTKRAITILDCGCGKSYLSFILYEYCKMILDREIRIIGIDSNPDLIDKCNKSAEELGFNGMQFYHTNVQSFKTDEKIDIVYSLHACDTATDQTIAAGVMQGAKYIFSVSCCQHTNRKNMLKHPLTSISKYQPYKERLVDMIGDTMRALLLEHLGYGVKLFEFSAAEYTPKNIMLRGVNGFVKKQDREAAMLKYQELVNMFNFSPALENLLNSYI